MYYIKQFFLTFIETIILFLTLFFIISQNSIFIKNKTLYLILFTCIFIGILALRTFIKRLKNTWTLKFSLKKVDNMTGIEFEEFLKLHFERLGCNVKMTKTSGDYGADLIVTYKGKKIAVQAKRYNSKIGVKAVQEVIGSIRYYHANLGLVVTNSTYTPNAITLAKANDILLWDRTVLMQMINQENMSKYLNQFLKN